MKEEIAIEPRVSVAIPLFNEEQSLPELLDRLQEVLSDLPGGRHEVVFVDDGSTDRTLEILRSQPLTGISEIILSLSRNFGHQAALTAALDAATGDVVVVLDGDLQDPPELIPLFLEQYRKGYDVVYCRRLSREGPLILRACYRVFYRMIAILSDVPLPLDSGDCSLISRRVVEVLRSAPERHRYLRGLRSWAGFRQTAIDVRRPARGRGESKYGFLSLLRLALDGIFSFSRIPLRFASIIGAISVGAASIFAVYAVYARLILNRSPEGFTALIVAIVFFAGVQMFFLGIIGEYLGRIYDEVKGRPPYVVSDTIRRE